MINDVIDHRNDVIYVQNHKLLYDVISMVYIYIIGHRKMWLIC